MKNSKKWMWALSVAFLFVTITAFAVTNNINSDKSVGNNTEIEKVTKADCDKCDKADCDGKCTSCKKRNKANASVKKSCSPHKCDGNCCKGSSAKKSCTGKSDVKAGANTKKVTEEAAKK